MICNYLTGLWKQGALMGNTASESFYVYVGLNETMTDDDIWNGRMIVQVGMAVVRPAEFIILQFMQLMQNPS
jgi:phage tail sheath protein FI